ncbi:MAG: protein-glutamate O-methyltransferase CheR [Clostridiales bacterium]|nr:protein-glutamate O-methyltransferase CheR [Clostridiales bacterium]
MLYLTDEEFNFITDYMKTNYGVNLIKKRTLIEGRLSNYVIGLGFNNYMDYYRYAINGDSEDEMATLINKLTTNHTYFLMENDHFEFYRDTVLPWVDKTLKSRDLRVWSAGCSSGQEPYTLSMITLNYLGAEAPNWDSTILASDISGRALLAAKEGIYSRENLSDVPKDWLRKYFIALDRDRYSVSETLKKNVAFRTFNLLSPFPFKKPFQAIFCRNVMIYFDLPTKNEVINKFYDALLPGGYLFIGLSESLSGCKHKFKFVKPSIYQKID